MKMWYIEDVVTTISFLFRKKKGKANYKNFLNTLKQILKLLNYSYAHVIVQ